MRDQDRLSQSVIRGVGLVIVCGISVATASRVGSGPSEMRQDAELSRASFAEVAGVLRHPRCLNCHTNTSFPRVGEQRARHAQNVQRGPDGRGVPGMRCSTCHTAENQDLSGLPGAPGWHLAPLSMGWEGLDDHDLAEALKDPAKNGNRTLEDLLLHMEKDALVGWAWDPGPGRASPPVSREHFVESFETWIDQGAVSPRPGTTTTF